MSTPDDAPPPAAPDPATVRARDGLAAARLLLDNGLPGPAGVAASRSALDAADEALRLLGRHPDRDAGTVTLFVRYVVRERGMEAEIGRRLRRVVNIDQYARTASEPLAADVARDAVLCAEAVLDAVTDWIEASRQVARQRSAMRGAVSRLPIDPDDGGRPDAPRVTAGNGEQHWAGRDR